MVDVKYIEVKQSEEANKVSNNSLKPNRKHYKIDNTTPKHWQPLLERDAKAGRLIPHDSEGNPIPTVIFGAIRNVNPHKPDAKKVYDLLKFRMHNIPHSSCHKLRQIVRKGWPVLDYYIPEQKDLPAPRIDDGDEYFTESGWKLELRRNPNAFNHVLRFCEDVKSNHLNFASMAEKAQESQRFMDVMTDKERAEFEKRAAAKEASVSEKKEAPKPKAKPDLTVKVDVDKDK